MFIGQLFIRPHIDVPCKQNQKIKLVTPACVVTPTTTQDPPTVSTLHSINTRSDEVLSLILYLLHGSHCQSHVLPINSPPSAN